MIHVALGWPYRRRHVQQGPVVYCLFEGLTGFSARAEAFRRVHLSEGDEAVPFYLMPTRLALVKQRRALIDSILQQCPEFDARILQLTGLRFGLNSMQPLILKCSWRTVVGARTTLSGRSESELRSLVFNGINE